MDVLLASFYPSGFFVLVNLEMDLIEQIYKEFFFSVHYCRKICLHDWVIMKRGFLTFKLLKLLYY